MKQFNDSKGNTWRVEMNVGTIKRIRDTCGIDLLEAPKGQVIVDLSENEVLILEVLLATLRPQIDQQGMSDDEFFACLVGDGIDKAYIALLDDLADFFRDPAKRRAMKTLLNKLRETEARADKLMADRVNDPRIDKAINQAFEDASRRFTDSLDSLASTPTP